MTGYQVIIHRTEEYVYILEAENRADLDKQVAGLCMRDARDPEGVCVPGTPLRAWISHTQWEPEYEEERESDAQH